MSIFEKTNQRALASVMTLLGQWLPGGIQQGDEYVVRNPTRADATIGSFRVNTNTARWADFATGDKGGDVISLYAYLERITQLEAAKKLAVFLGVETPKMKSSDKRKDRGVSIQPIPLWVLEKEVPPHPTLGVPEHMYAYHNANGEKTFFNCRFRNSGKKEDRPLTYRAYSNGTTKWSWQSVERQRPLYNLHDFKPNKRVLVCEGEKAADAARLLWPDFTVTTSPNGAHNAAHADWSPCAGLDVTVWPDNDDDGKAYADDVAAFAQAAGANTVRIVRVPQDFPPKWDLADTVPPGYNLDSLVDLLTCAESVEDLHEALFTECRQDAGAAFKANNLKLLLDLQEENKSGYESFRDRLKNETDTRMVELDKAIRKAGSSGEVAQKQIDVLLSIAGTAELFHNASTEVFAAIETSKSCQIWPIGSTAFKKWLTQKFYEEMGTAPNSESLNAAINTVSAQASFKGAEKEVFIRTAADNGKLYLDLCNKDWSVVEIDESGWRILKTSPVYFVRSAGMLPLPEPSNAPDIESLRELLNLTDDNSFILVIAWLLGALRHSTQYPIMAVMGEYGSAKSSCCELLRRIIDPNTAQLRTFPKDERDLYISAVNSYSLAYDNISRISNAMSDALCRISTGGGFSTRTLYTNDEERIFSATRPIILNGIEDIVTRSDLADRCITLTLREIPEEARKSKSSVNQSFDNLLPHILSGLLNGMVHGLRNFKNIEHKFLPRMADFAHWVSSCEAAFWPTGTFMAAYNSNRTVAQNIAIENCAVARAIIELMTVMTVWTGSATDFLNHFKYHVEYPLCPDWPQNPEGVSGAIRRMSNPLRSHGIIIKTGQREGSHKRVITISRHSQHRNILS